MSTELTADNHSKHLHSYDGSKSVFGFWIYIMSDCILFATLFAVYGVFHTHTFGGPSGKELFSLQFVFIETILLLISSFTFGLATLSHSKTDIKMAITWLGVTFILGMSFIIMELHEFYHLFLEGFCWKRSAFLSSFFTLVGTHGLHIAIGLIWILNIIYQIYNRGIIPMSRTKLTHLGLFWHFLDIVWIFIFSIVYLMGAI